VKIDSSPVYLDSSGLAKIYITETGSAEMEETLVGRSDLLVSDLAITEVTSALYRRVRARDLSASQARAVYHMLMQHLAAGMYLWIDVPREAHSGAERILSTVGRNSSLRAADALHLAVAIANNAAAILTYDRHLRLAAQELGSLAVVP
jgi:predicted nucleic acid-binding protein